jgi:thiamine-phosphate pyrophosphorylase
MIGIAITPPQPFELEPLYIKMIIDAGWSRVHLRHPQASADTLRRILDALTADSVARVRLHDHHELAAEYPVDGIHLNSRRPDPPQGYDGHASRSCHSLSEVKAPRHRLIDYVTLSPVMDSVSKPGYKAAFTHSQLAEITPADHVVALGGMTPLTIPAISGYAFEGVAVLGYLFNARSTAELSSRLTNLSTFICCNS